MCRKRIENLIRNRALKKKKRNRALDTSALRPQYAGD